MDILHTLFYTDLNSWSHYVETHTAGSLTSQERLVISPYWWSMDRNNISCWLFKLQFIETWVKPLLKLYSCIFTLSSMYHAAIALAGKKTIVGQRTSYIYIFIKHIYIYDVYKTFRFRELPPQCASSWVWKTATSKLARRMNLILPLHFNRSHVIFVMHTFICPGNQIIWLIKLLLNSWLYLLTSVQLINVTDDCNPEILRKCFCWKNTKAIKCTIVQLNLSKIWINLILNL